MSDSEMEEEVAKVDLSAVDHAAGKLKGSGQSSVRLAEIGPRMTLKLAKVEAGMASGDVLYHAFGPFPVLLVFFIEVGRASCVLWIAVKKTPDQLAAEAKARLERQKVRCCVSVCEVPESCEIPLSLSQAAAAKPVKPTKKRERSEQTFEIVRKQQVRDEGSEGDDEDDSDGNTASGSDSD
jgi:hypothetical protein